MKKIDLVVLAVAFVSSGCANGQTKQEDRLAFTVKWLPPCSAGISEPYFTVDVFFSGKVRFVGGEEVREHGERQLQLNSERTTALIRSIQHLREGSKRPTPQLTGIPLPEYCLEVIESKNGRSVVTRGAGVERRMQPLINNVGRMVEENKWVCPARETTHFGPNLLSAIQFCNGSGKDPAVRFTMFEKTDCIVYGVGIYRDVIHYVATLYSEEGRHRGTPSEILIQRYYPINNSQFIQLITVTRALELHQSELQAVSSPMNMNYAGSKPDDVLRLKSEIDKIANIDWVEMPAGSTSCRDSKSHLGNYLLKYEFAQPAWNP